MRLLTILFLMLFIVFSHLGCSDEPEETDPNMEMDMGNEDGDDDDDDGGGNNSDTTSMELLPSYWERDGQILGKIFYDVEFRIKMIKTYVNFEMDYYTSLFDFKSYGPYGVTESTYVSDGGTDQKSEYFYKDGLLDSISNRAAGWITPINFYYSAEKDCPLDSTIFVFDDDPPVTTRYTYTDENCSVIKKGENTRDYSMEYDDKRGFLHYRDHHEKIQYFMESFNPQHNIVKYEERLFFTGEIIEGDSYTSEYTYNEQDFPISEKRTYYDGDVEEYKFYYIEK